MDAGIIDPVSVLCNSLEFGAGVASLLITSEIAIVNEHKQIHYEH